MFKIHGPTYLYQGENLDADQWVYITDHCYNEQDKCFHLRHLLNNNVGQQTLVFDHVNNDAEFDDYQKIYLPTLLAKETDEFLDENIAINWNNKTCAFNFMINKPRVHRTILLDLIVEQQLTNYSHSLCWKESYKSIHPTNYLIGGEVELEKGIKNGNFLNARTYNELLKTHVFEPSCVSLITEPVYYERQTIVTEKTIMAIYGGTVPIWIGGWGIPDYMKSIGFDIFDDLVDHSYQYHPDPLFRCQDALIKNIHLLKQTVQVDLTRLQHNYQLLITNPWLSQVNNLIEIYPDLRKA